NSSSSTTSFISSIGNGEAIAFGEAVAVPMRMKFARVKENRLPRASGAGVKVSDDTPDTVDLRSIVGRMRSVSGPDISAFQNAYLAGENAAASDHENTGFDEPYGDEEGHADTGFAPPPLHDMSGPSASSQIEPYRPEMLPRAPSPLSAQDRFEALRRELGAEHPAERATPPRPAFGEAGGEPRREGSIRDQLLKKPLSSLLRK
ncbi:MAG TPA: ATPase, partial [Mycoplana sp.]|nr:ATPase [Mycoplana sp.]